MAHLEGDVYGGLSASIVALALAFTVVMMAGGFQLLFGFLKLRRYVINALSVLPEYMAHLNPNALAVGVVTLLVIAFTPRRLGRLAPTPLTVFVDVITAVAVGIVIARLVFVKEMAEVQVQSIKTVSDPVRFESRAEAVQAAAALLGPRGA
ncbi:MAG: hypothetical protein RQ826_03965 [Xanthomonadales bacterium]|nr:hypothetical protein [Xanthomonadales bacterium]